MAQPSLPKIPSSSLRKTVAKTAPMMTDKAPSGVTKIGGAKVYAAKLAISPTAIRKVPKIHIGFFKYENDSPCDPSLIKPFLVSTNDEPIAKEDEIANANPMYLSSMLCRDV
ncbi:unnamed protein product [Ambrosiozyma monospora]|uniref:Unnamed protein product n=1 Tax=Ambrosiozyma monospora TaxID=43982 RepID=A0A9W7DFS2_AMBMO|nr:unnamed protein product [Ambrosiozyma monospora]